jgi:hypothetical protein
VTANLKLRAAITLIGQNLAQIDLDPPKPYADQLDAIAGWVARTDTLTVDRTELATAVADCLAAGKDPAANPDVAAMLVRAGLARENVAQDVTGIADQRRAAVLHEHADTLLDLLAGEVDRLDTVLTEARDAVGDRMARALKDPSYATGSLRPDQLAAWGRARDAIARLGVSFTAWKLIVTTTGRAHVDPKSRTQLLAVADLDADQLDEVVRYYGTDPTAPAVAGHRLSLATPEGYRERVAKVEQQRTDARQPDTQQDRRAAVAR